MQIRVGGIFTSSSETHSPPLNDEPRGMVRTIRTKQ